MKKVFQHVGKQVIMAHERAPGQSQPTYHSRARTGRTPPSGRLDLGLFRKYNRPSREEGGPAGGMDLALEKRGIRGRKHGIRLGMKASAKYPPPALQGISLG